MFYIKRFLFRKKMWYPKKLKDKIRLALSSDINIYGCSSSVEVCTKDISTSIIVLERVLSVDYDLQYVMDNNTRYIMPFRTTYLPRWYTVDNTVIDNELLAKWLKLLYKVNGLYLDGLHSGTTERAHVNSVKISPVIQEGHNILTALLISD